MGHPVDDLGLVYADNVCNGISISHVVPRVIVEHFHHVVVGDDGAINLVASLVRLLTVDKPVVGALNLMFDLIALVDEHSLPVHELLLPMVEFSHLLLDSMVDMLLLLKTGSLSRHLMISCGDKVGGKRTLCLCLCRV